MHIEALMSTLESTLFSAALAVSTQWCPASVRAFGVQLQL